MTTTTATQTILDVEAIGHTYGAGPTAYEAISRLDFAVRKGELVCIVGPSGAG